MNRWEKIKKGSLYSFKGGIYPSEHKNTCHTPSESMPNPNKLVLPLRQHSGSAAEILVQVGQHVLANEPLTAPKSRMQVPIHAPLSGTIEAIDMEEIAHPSGLKEPCIVLVPDPASEQKAVTHQKFPDFQSIPREELIAHIKSMGIAGLGGAGFPTDVKLSSSIADNSCELLIINGAECEPYITCDDRLMQERPIDVIKGIKILQYILQPKYTVIAIEDNKPEAIKHIENAIIEVGLADTRVTVLPVKYPSGAARNLITLISGIEIPYGARSNSYGVVVHNVTTAYTIGDAILNGQPLTKRMVTVAGAALKKEVNLWTYLGTSVIDLLNHCGYTAPQTPRVIMGGPMMGFTLHKANVPIIKTSNCVIAPAEDEIKRVKPQVACIRCGKCARVCPSRLIPYELYGYCRNDEHELSLKNGLKSCIECGCCSFVCPSAIRLVAEFRMEKAQIKLEKLKADKLNIARARFEAKKLREIEEEKARAERKAAALAKINAAKAQAQAQAKAQTEALSQELNKASDLLNVKNTELTPEQKEARKQAAIAKAKAMREAKTAAAQVQEQPTATQEQPASSKEELLNKPNSALTPEEKEARKQAAIAKAKAMREAKAATAQVQEQPAATQEQPASSKEELLNKPNSALTPEEKEARKQAAIAKAKAMREAKAATAQVQEQPAATQEQPASSKEELLNKPNSALTPEEKEARKQAAIAKAKAMREAKLALEKQNENK